MDIKNVVLNIVKIVCNNDEITLESDLFGDGYIDSLGLVNLLLEFEKSLGTYIPITEINREEKLTPLMLLEYIVKNENHPK